MAQPSAAKTVRVLGIDPGSRNTGWAVVDLQGNRYSHVASGTLRLGAGDVAGRLKGIFEGISELCVQHQPQEFAIEQAFMSKNADSALKLGQARGAAICAAAMAELPVAEYAPRAVKQSVAGSGAANKTQVQQMVASLLALPLDSLQADQADAIAVALCHAHYRQLGPLVDATQAVQLRKGRSGKQARGWSAWRSYAKE
jgi:crossover junction endodeoxyribonuclease RuvC